MAKIQITVRSDYVCPFCYLDISLVTLDSDFAPYDGDERRMDSRQGEVCFSIS